MHGTGTAQPRSVVWTGVEYAFGGHGYDYSGIFQAAPRTGLQGVAFRQSIAVGTVDLTPAQLDALIVSLGRQYTGQSYNLLTRNCNHFTDELVQRLCDTSAPAWINRLAKLGAPPPAHAALTRVVV